MAGPYWVIALGSNDDGQYEWAIVSSGAPSVATDDGCTYAEVRPAACFCWWWQGGSGYFIASAASAV